MTAPGTAVCPICPRHCVLAEGQTGACRARVNRGGAVVCGNYGRLTALALDPVEKKPLRRFHPGAAVLSVGSYGCNLRCPWCQNAEISMADAEAETRTVTPATLVEKALALRPSGNIGLAFTYNEPLVGWEFVYDTARLLHEAGLAAVVVTNGMICEAPLQKLLPYVDAMNIDLKGFTRAAYDRAGGDLETVKRAIALSAAACHVEVTTLAVPGVSDGEADMAAEAAWLAALSPEIPLHVSRFFPRWHMADAAPAPVETVYRLRDIAARYLRYVYTGNC